MISDDDAGLFSVRQVGDRWSVYRWSTLEIARVHGTAQVDLERDVADAIAEFLTNAERRHMRASDPACGLRTAA